MKNVLINGVTYNSVPRVEIPVAGGESGEKAVFVETSDATATAADIRTGKTAYAGGAVVEGTLSTVTVSQDSSTKVVSIS